MVHLTASVAGGSSKECCRDLKARRPGESCSAAAIAVRLDALATLADAALQRDDTHLKMVMQLLSYQQMDANCCFAFSTSLPLDHDTLRGQNCGPPSPLRSYKAHLTHLSRDLHLGHATRQQARRHSPRNKRVKREAAQKD